jgi:anhydro-N-acetylmuramic acid kinase
LNHYTRLIDLEFDDKGKIAAQGILHNELLNELNNLPFYKDDKPKSLGYEFIIETILPMIDKYDLKVNTILRTFIEHVAMQIAAVIDRINSTTNNKMPSVLVTGGGAFNDYLIHRISELSKASIIIPDKEIIDFKEALIFALLGVLKDQNQVNCLKSVTGAKKDHSSGVVFEV